MRKLSIVALALLTLAPPFAEARNGKPAAAIQQPAQSSALLQAEDNLRECLLDIRAKLSHGPVGFHPAYTPPSEIQDLPVLLDKYERRGGNDARLISASKSYLSASSLRWVAQQARGVSLSVYNDTNAAINEATDTANALVDEISQSLKQSYRQ